jgi:hypothetical protein
MVAVALLVFASAVPGAATCVRAVRRASGVRLGLLLLATSFLVLVLTAAALLELAGLSLAVSAEVALAVVTVAWVLALLARCAAREIARRLPGPEAGGITKIPPWVRDITLIVLLTAVVAAVLAGGWLAHDALSGAAC